MNDALSKSNHGMAFAGSIIAVVIGWVLNSLVTGMQLQRTITNELLDRLSVVEVRVERLEVVQNRVERNVFRGTDKDDN